MKYFLVGILLQQLVYNGHCLIGDACSLPNGKSGLCRPLPLCPGSVDAYMRNPQSVTLCETRGTVLVVCCPNKSRTVGEISKKKCKDYSQLAWETIDDVALSYDAKPIKIYDCKIDNIPLIVGGEQAEYGEFPHMVLLGYVSKQGELSWKCGGSIISEQYILTAAHCIDAVQAQLKYVATGFVDKNNSNGKIVGVLQTHIPEGRTGLINHDIALLKVEPIEFSPRTRPACLNTKTDVRQFNFIATGWGRLGPRKDVSDLLMKVKLTWFDLQTCEKSFPQLINDDRMICAGSHKEIKDTCKGDSGGPLQIVHPQSDGVQCMYDLVGITSFGRGCGDNLNQPGVYTRVSYFIKWIEDIVWPEN